MIAEIAHFCLILALITALFTGVTGVISGYRDSRSGWAVCQRGAFVLLLLISGSFFGLMSLFALSDFSVLSVVKHSHTAKPIIYKLAATWGFHEGSMLLWVLILGLMAAFSAGMARHFPRREMSYALGIQGLLAASFLGFIILTSNPFLRVPKPPVQGEGFNPILQDPALAAHPPLLYLGYVGFSALFALAVAAMLTGRVDSGWARRARPFAFLAWTALSAGIALGSFWAYYELGWGGWWFWDPVENASLLPWLAGTALVHSLIVLDKRGILQAWTLLLAILCFSLSVLGTFLVRSGLLSSVHSFASDPARGVYILMILGLFSGGALLIFGLRKHQPPPVLRFSALSRESALILNNLLMCVMTLTIFIGTLYPLLMQALDVPPVTVGAPYFNVSVLPVAIPMVVLMAVAPLIRWSHISPQRLGRRMITPALMLTGACLIMWWLGRPTQITAIAGIALGLWAITGGVMYVNQALSQTFNQGYTGNFLSRLRRLPGQQWAVTLAHGGLGVAIIGMTGIGVLASETRAVMSPGERINHAGYIYQLDDIRKVDGPNYTDRQATLQVTHGDANLFHLRPAKRAYHASGQETSEAGIVTRGLVTHYSTVERAASGGGDNEAQWIIHLRHQPLAPLLWLGFLLVVTGGVIATWTSLRTLSHGRERQS